jgi:hypothetical protein
MLLQAIARFCMAIEPPKKAMRVSGQVSESAAFNSARRWRPGIGSVLLLAKMSTIGHLTLPDAASISAVAALAACLEEY